MLTIFYKFYVGIPDSERWVVEPWERGNDVGALNNVVTSTASLENWTKIHKCDINISIQTKQNNYFDVT
jgi:hypothetical protein